VFFFSFSYCLPVCGEIKLYIYRMLRFEPVSLMIKKGKLRQFGNDVSD